MSIIFPGNYVAHLNAYREQGVEAIPGVEFYRAVGAVVLNPDTKGALTDGELAAGDHTAYILSPDLRQDDKPRVDKPLVIPTGAVVYRTAISGPGVKSVGGTAKIKAATGLPTSVAITADADGYYPENGAGSVLVSILDGTALAGDTDILLTTDAVSTASLNPSAGACRNSPSALIVEVCYYVPAPGPDAEDAHIPFAVEAGSGT